MFRIFFALMSRGRGPLAVLLIGLGAVLSWQSLAAAADDVFHTSSVRRESNDLQMFGKQLSLERVGPELNLDELKPGSGPVVPVRLRIPALAVDAVVEAVGVRNGRMDVPGNIWKAGWLNNSPRPGQPGSAVMSGHKDSVQGAAVFYDLNRLQPGDKIYVSDEGGFELTFEVSEVQSYPAEQAPLARIFGSGSGAATTPELNLITCDGDFLSGQHTYARRLVVYSRWVAA